jgi:CrcB protein
MEDQHPPQTTSSQPEPAFDGQQEGLAGERGLFARHEHDVLEEEPLVPLVGLSATAMAGVFVGGALGTVARYLLEAHHPLAPGDFPWATLLVNLTGSFAIGLVLPLTEHFRHRFPVARPLVVVGFLGGWTTYSTLAVDAVLLARHGDVLTCLAYLVATVAGGLALVVAGHALGRRVVPA